MSEDEDEISQEEIYVDWNKVKSTYLKGDDLRDVAVENGISVPDIMLKAHTNNWGMRGSIEDIDKTDVKLRPIDVVAAHRDDLLRLRLTASVVQHQITQIVDPFSKVKIMEKLANIYSKILPMERIAYNVDVNTGDAPHKINIFMNGEEVPRVEAEEEDGG